MDIIADLAVPLPGTVIADMLGVPAEDHSQFKRWSDDIAAGLTGTATLGSLTPESFLTWSPILTQFTNSSGAKTLCIGVSLKTIGM